MRLAEPPAYLLTMDDTPTPNLPPETEEERCARLAWEAERIAEARASATRLGTVPFEEVEAWVESWGTDHELPKPKPRKE